MGSRKGPTDVTRPAQRLQRLRQRRRQRRNVPHARVHGTHTRAPAHRTTGPVGRWVTCAGGGSSVGAAAPPFFFEREVVGVGSTTAPRALTSEGAWPRAAAAVRESRA
eukprot:2927929-Prymnesium_polylepis.1